MRVKPLPEPSLAAGWVKWIGRALVLALAAAHTSVAVLNQSMNEDGIAYLDLGDAWIRGDWGAIVNTTWSPLYAVILGTVVNIVGVSPVNEFPLVQVINFFVLVVTLMCFEYCWRRLGVDHCGSEARSAPTATMSEPMWWAVGYSLFAWASLNLIEVWAVTPDMLVAAIVYLAAGIWVSVFVKGEVTRLKIAAFGAILGVGYLVKAVLFPLGIAFLVLTAWLTGRSWRPNPQLAPAFIAFAVVTAPLVIATSIASGYPTFSDVGRFTYLKHVNSMPYPGFEAVASKLDGTILHGPRKLFTEPDVYEFAEPVAGTYPLGTDPAYWTRGVQPVVAIGSQLNAIASNIMRYFELFARTQGGVVTAIALLTIIAVRRSWRPQVRSAAFGLVAWAGIALGLYVLVRVQERYVAPFVVLLLAGLLAWPRLPDSRGARQLITTAAVLITVWQWVNIGAVNLAEAGKLVGVRPGTQDAEVHDESGAGAGHNTNHVAVALALKAEGFSPGDRIAFAGYSYSAFWARLARLRIVAEVRPDDAALLWAMPTERMNELVTGLAKLGVVAFVAEPRNDARRAEQRGWRNLGHTGYFVWDMRPAGSAGPAGMAVGTGVSADAEP